MSLGTAQLLDTGALTKPPSFSGNEKIGMSGTSNFWDLLCAQCEPTTSTRTAGVLQALTSPGFQERLVGVFVASVGSGSVPARERIRKAMQQKGITVVDSGHHDSNPRTKNETTPMDVDALWKGKGKGGKYGKGKDKGKGKVRTKKAEKEKA
eukprot:3390572-Amphidinium_carterae.1